MDGVNQTIRMNNLSRELRKYGFAQTSQEAIAQAGAIYAENPEEYSSEIEIAEISKAQYTEIMNKMQRLWVFKNNTNQKIDSVVEQISKVTEKLNELIKSMSIMEMNQTVFDKKLNSLKDNIHESFREQKQGSRQEHVEKSSGKEVQEQLEDKPIDRNGVAPADVSIEKVFYSGSRK